MKIPPILAKSTRKPETNYPFPVVRYSTRKLELISNTLSVIVDQFEYGEFNSDANFILDQKYLNCSFKLKFGT